MAANDWMNVNTEERTPNNPFPGIMDNNWNDYAWPYLTSLENSPMQFIDRKNKEAVAQRELAAKYSRPVDDPSIEHDMEIERNAREKMRAQWAGTSPEYAPVQPVYTPESKSTPQQATAPNAVNNQAQGITRYAPTKPMLAARPGLTPEQMNINKAAFQKMHPGYDAQGYDKYGAQQSTPMPRANNKAGNLNANSMNDLNMRNASMGLINMGDTAEIQRMGIGSKPQAQAPDTRRQDYINRVANKPLPQRDMRPQQNAARQTEMTNNQLQHRTNNASQLTKYDEQPDYNIQR